MRLFCLSLLVVSFGIAQEMAIQLQVREIADGVSEERIAATIQKLASFPTRNTLSTEGVVAAGQWIVDEKRYSPRLQVTLEHFKVKKNEDRIFRDVDLYNVVAVLPGMSMPETQVLITSHYDTLDLVPLPGQPPVEPAYSRHPARATKGLRNLTL